MRQWGWRWGGEPQPLSLHWPVGCFNEVVCALREHSMVPMNSKLKSSVEQVGPTPHAEA